MNIWSILSFIRICFKIFIYNFVSFHFINMKNEFINTKKLLIVVNDDYAKVCNNSILILSCNLLFTFLHLIFRISSKNSYKILSKTITILSHQLLLPFSICYSDKIIFMKFRECIFNVFEILSVASRIIKNNKT
jgi:hypothetical protein